MSNLLAKNTTLSSITVSGYKVYSVDSSNVEQVTVENTNSDKFNALKFIYNNINYYYVIDGIHNTWTDDLSIWGYSEVQPAPSLPTVETITGQYNYGNYNTTLDWGYSINTNFTYDDSKLYCASTEKFDYTGGIYYGLSVWNDSGTAFIRNDTGSSISLKWWHLYYVDSANTVVITVYNNSNVAYNAFKYTLNNVDYYYVLDGIQTNWVSDLSSIGYHNYIDVVVGLRWNASSTPKEWLAKTFSTNDWWWAGIMSQADADVLSDVGIITESTASKQWCGTIGGVAYNPNYDYEILTMYSDLGETSVAFDNSNFWIGKQQYGSTYDYEGACVIHSGSSGFSTATKCYKMRIKPGGNRNSILYGTDDGSMATFLVDTWYYLFRSDGTKISFTNIPTAIGYYAQNTSYTLQTGYNQYFEFKEADGYLIFKIGGTTNLSLSRLVVHWS